MLTVSWSCGKDGSPTKTDELILSPCQFNINVDDEIPIDTEITAVIDVTRKDTTYSYPLSINRRGGLSIGYPKHSYTVEMRQAIQLCNLPIDNDYVFNANYIDKTFMRHKVSYELFREMNSINEAASAEYCELAINDEYNGLYLIMEKLTKSSLYINQSDPNAYIFKDPPIFRENIDAFVPQDPSNFHQQTYPNKSIRDFSVQMETLRSFILNTTDSIFQQEVWTQFEKENIIDWHLLLLLSNNSDGILKNFYLYKVGKEVPARIAIWDYDHSFGRDGDNELNLIDRVLDVERSILLKRLLQWDDYQLALKTRWETLNQNGLFSLNSLTQRFRLYQDQLRPFIDRNFDLWPLDGNWYYDDNDFEQECTIIFEYLALRHPQLQVYFDQL